MKVSRTFTLNNVVASFVKVYEPVPKMNGKGKEYSVQIILPKDHPQAEEFKKCIQGMATEAFPGKTVAADSRLIRDADAEGKAVDYPYMENSYFFNLRRSESQGQPPCAMPDGKLFTPTPMTLFSGCIVNMHIGMFTYAINAPGTNNVIKFGVSGSINGIQLVDNKTVERLGGGAAVPTFGVVENANVAMVEEALGGGHEPAEQEQEEQIPW
jgi:hypothetical protein